MPDATTSDGDHDSGQGALQPPDRSPSSLQSRDRSRSPDRRPSSCHTENGHTSPNSSSSGKISDEMGSTSVPNPATAQRINKIRRMFTIMKNVAGQISRLAVEVAMKLIQSLVCNFTSLEEFCGRITALTGLRLKAFVLPFLRANLAVMQGQLTRQARDSHTTLFDYVGLHEEALVDKGVGGEAREIFEQRKRVHQGFRMDSLQPADYREALQNINQMLDCIVAMVDKTRRLFALLERQQQSSCRSEEAAYTLDLGRCASSTPLDLFGVHRHGTFHLGKAVNAADYRTDKVISVERTKLEDFIFESRRQDIFNHLNRQHRAYQQPPVVNTPLLKCWNCGREANDSCSGCGLARYCSPFCQHRHWTNHYRICQTLRLGRTIRPSNENLPVENLRAELMGGSARTSPKPANIKQENVEQVF